MSIFHASFQKARSGMLTNICEIEKVEELTDEEYERFSQNLTVSSELLSQESDRFRVDEHGIARCLLVMAEGRQDGTLVLTEGYDYARHTVHLPNARQFLKMEQSFHLTEFVDRMHSITNQFVADAIDRQVEGEYKISLAPIRNKVVNDSFSASLFMEMLSERPEIAEVDYDYENDTVSVALADEHIRFTDESGMRYLTEQDIEVMCAKHMLRLAERLKAEDIKTMLISDPSRISLDPNDFIEIVSAFHKNGVTIEYQDGDGNTRNLLEVLEQLRTANLNLAEPECDEDEEQDESPRIQM